jgi:hypothetical protein
MYCRNKNNSLCIYIVHEGNIVLVIAHVTFCVWSLGDQQASQEEERNGGYFYNTPPSFVFHKTQGVSVLPVSGVGKTLGQNIVR